MRELKLMYRGWLSCVLVSCGLLFASPQLLAVELDDLYEASVNVYSQAQSERQQGLEQAFEQMLLKVSGSQAVMEHDDIQAAIKQVNSYVVQYSYRNENNQQKLWARFDDTKVDALLRRVDAPVWGDRRPRLMVWLALETEQGERDVIASDNETVFKQQFLNRARERGVPVAMPLMDLTDRMRVSVTDIWGRFNEPLRRAAARYEADGILTGKVYRETFGPQAGNWVIDWQASIGNERLYGRTVGMDTALMATPMMDELANELAEIYGIRESDAEASELNIRVVNLKDLTGVLEVETFLTSLAIIEKVELTAFGANNAEFKLHLRGNAQRAQQTISLDRRMQVVNENPFATVATTPEYEWQH